MLQEDYFVIERTVDAPYPLLAWEDSRGEIGLGSPVVLQELLKFSLQDPIPDNYEFADVHFASELVVSKRLAQIIDSLNIYGIQLLPAEIMDAKSPFLNLDTYYLVHVFNRISCVDKDQSECDEYDDGSIFGFDSLVLSESILGSVPLPNRMIFELAEKTSITVIHRLLKDEIEKVNPSGIRFFKVSEWNSDIMFD